MVEDFTINCTDPVEISNLRSEIHRFRVASWELPIPERPHDITSSEPAELFALSQSPSVDTEIGENKKLSRGARQRRKRKIRLVQEHDDARIEALKIETPGGWDASAQDTTLADDPWPGPESFYGAGMFCIMEKVPCYG